MRNPFVGTFIIIFTTSFIHSCSRDVGEELYPCTSFQDVSYSKHIAPILSQNCYPCHSTANAPSESGIVLEGYSNLKIMVDDGRFNCAINHYSCAKEMPFGGEKLDQCIINEIETWVNEGALNN